MKSLGLPVCDIKLLRGDSFESDQFMLPINVGPDWQIWQIEDAIAAGTIRLYDWREYTIKADVKKDGVLWFSLSDHLVINDTGEKFWFAFSAEQTRTLSPAVGVYDLQICKDGNVQTILTGSVELIPDITDAAC